MPHRPATPPRVNDLTKLNITAGLHETYLHNNGVGIFKCNLQVFLLLYGLSQSEESRKMAFYFRKDHDENLTHVYLADLFKY